MTPNLRALSNEHCITRSEVELFLTKIYDASVLGFLAFPPTMLFKHMQHRCSGFFQIHAILPLPFCDCVLSDIKLPVKASGMPSNGTFSFPLAKCFHVCLLKHFIVHGVYFPVALEVAAMFSLTFMGKSFTIKLIGPQQP